MTGKVYVEPVLSNVWTDIPTYGKDFTGSIDTVFKYRIYKNIFEFGGSCRFMISVRTGSNPGVTFTIPENRKLKTIFNIPGAGLVSTSTFRGAEVASITADSVTKIRVQTTETMQNVPTGRCVLAIPYIRCALQ